MQWKVMVLVPLMAVVTNASAQRVGSRTATDPQGYCTPELVQDAIQLSRAARESAGKMTSIAARIIQAKTPAERSRAQIEMDYEVRLLSGHCDQFEQAWGTFTCKQKRQDGTEVQQSGAPLKQSCDELRAMNK